MRAEFNEYCVKHGLYNTLILFSKIPVIEDANIPAYAGITNQYRGKPGNWAIFINPKLFYSLNSLEQKFILIHELSHVGQMASKFVMENYKKDGKLLNVAMDMAIHENLRKISPEFEDILTHGPLKQGILRERILPNAPAGQDWYTYYLALKNDPNLQHMQGGEGEGEPMEGAGGVDRGEGRGGLDVHDFNTSEEARSATDKLVQETASAAKGIMRSQGRGNTPSDMGFFPSLTNVDTKLAEMLNRVRVTVANLIGGREKRVNWARYNRILDSDAFPGKKKVPSMSRKPNPVVVLDTSGSQWTPAILNQMFSGANLLRKQYPECDLYTCDTELARFDGKELKGGGGTIFDSSHITKILEDKKLSTSGTVDRERTLDIIYITDGEVCLNEATTDKRIVFHPVVWRP